MNTMRHKIAEYEADLYGVQEPSFLAKLLGLRTKNGEVETKEYNTGEKVMEIELHGLNVPDGTLVSAVVDANPVCELRVTRGHSRLVISTAQGVTVPQVTPGSVAEIRYQGGTLLKGIFKPD